MLGGGAYGAIYRDSAERNAALAGWLDFYNRRRPHGALSHKTPTARLTELNNLLGSYTHANTHAAMRPLITDHRLVDFVDDRRCPRCPRPLKSAEGFLRVCVLARRRQRPPDDARIYVRNH